MVSFLQWLISYNHRQTNVVKSPTSHFISRSIFTTVSWKIDKLSYKVKSKESWLTASNLFFRFLLFALEEISVLVWIANQGTNRGWWVVFFLYGWWEQKTKIAQTRYSWTNCAFMPINQQAQCKSLMVVFLLI